MTTNPEENPANVRNNHIQPIHPVWEGCSKTALENDFNSACWSYSEPVCQGDKLLTSIFRWSGSQWKFRATGARPIDGGGRIWSMGSPSMINLSGWVLWSTHTTPDVYGRRLVCAETLINCLPLSPALCLSLAVRVHVDACYTLSHCPVILTESFRLLGWITSL